MDAVDPYKPGEVVVIRRFRFLPKRPAKDAFRTRLQAKNHLLMVKVVHMWRSSTGTPYYSALVNHPNGKMGLWLRRRMDKRDQRVFFGQMDVMRSEISAREVTHGDYSPVL